jgi:hypothetical protein
MIVDDLCDDILVLWLLMIGVMIFWLKKWDYSHLREKLVLMRILRYVGFVESIKVKFLTMVHLDAWLV